jgi:hypothetical protein
MSTGRSRYGDGQVLSVPAVRKDGARISVEFIIVPFTDASGQMIGIAAIMRDVTARFEELRALRRQLAAHPPPTCGQRQFPAVTRRLRTRNLEGSHMPTIETALTRLLAIEHPIILAPMGSAAGGKLASAVTTLAACARSLCPRPSRCDDDPQGTQ